MGIDKLVPWFAGLCANKIVIVIVQGEAILVNISKEVVSSQNFCNLHKLIVVVAALEEWFLLEDHAGKHATK